MLPTIPNAPTEPVECRCTDAVYRWRGRRIAVCALALCLVSLGLGFGAALLAGRRLGR